MSREEKKTITIRGIDKSLYEQIAKIARDSGKTIGEVINEAMRCFLSLTLATVKAGSKIAESIMAVGRAFSEGIKEGMENVCEVSGVEELSINKEDLESIEEPLVFKNIKKLKFSDDIPYDLFDKKVYSIIYCDEVIVPPTYPKLKVVKKCRLVKRIITAKK